jgi:hypothetical protein
MKAATAWAILFGIVTAVIVLVCCWIAPGVTFAGRLGATACVFGVIACIFALVSLGDHD